LAYEETRTADNPRRAGLSDDDERRALEATVPEATVPEATVPEATVPEATVPEAAVIENS